MICVDELGPISPRSFPPSPGWSRDGHRIKSPLEYSRGPDRLWVYGGLRVADGHVQTMPARSRNSAHYIQFLTQLEKAHPAGDLYLIADNLSSHLSFAVRTWLAQHPRLKQIFIPKGACWLNLQEGWWRLFRRTALAGQTFADSTEITLATAVATTRLNQQAKPWMWGRPQPPPRYRRRTFLYHL